MTPIERDAVASWLEHRHHDGTLHGMSWGEMEAEIHSELGLDVDAGQIYGALMEAGSRRERRAAMARRGGVPEELDKPLFALVPMSEVAPMMHEDDRGYD